MKTFKKILKWVVVILLFFIIAGTIFINTDWGQNIIARAVTNRLSKDLKSKISIKHVSFSLFDKMNLEGVVIEDQQKDTLLSAGKMQVRITDWFFFKDKIVLHYIELGDAVIHLNRTDSVWNYQYLVDYFSGGSSSGGAKKGVELDFKRVKLNNVSFLKKDAWRGEDMQFQLTSMDLDADIINFNNKTIEIKSIDFSDPVFLIKNYAGNRPKKEKVVNENEEIIDEQKIGQGTSLGDTSLKWNPDGWAIHIDQLNISNGDFKNIKVISGPYNDFFDGRNIDFAAINASFKNVIFNKDTLTTSLELSTKERSGFEVKSMVADAKLTPHEMSFDKLEIKTNNSIIRDYFSMKFEDFSDMSDFITKIRMQARFEDAEIDSDDIAFFAPALKAWDKKIKISGLARGTVDDIFGNEMTIQAGNNTYLNGDISLTGLPDINKTFIDFKANSFRTTYTDAVTFIPRIRNITTPRLQSISFLDFNGSFTGFVKDFVTYGTIRTNLGTITSDLNMKLPEGKEPFYSGNIASQNFNLGVFVNNPQIGTISFEGQVKGRGLKWNSISADMDGYIDHLVYRNYHYENIKAKGSLRNKIFNGDFSIKDTNAVASLHGIVDLSSKVPRFNFLADVDTLNLKSLKILRDDISFAGKLDFNFTGDNIDNFLGNASIRNATVTKDGRSIPLDSFVINSEYIEGAKYLSVRSPEIEGNITGDFSLKDLPETFKLFLNKYYPAYIRAPRKIGDQAFTFNIKTNYVSDLLNLFDTTLQGFNNSEITGRLNTRQNQLELDTYVPAFGYKQYEFQNVNIKGRGTLQNLAVTTTIDHVKVSDSLSFPFTQIDLLARNDSTNVKFITESDNKNISGGSINALVRTFDDGLAVKFDTSNFILNGKRWAIEENGELELRSNRVSHGEIVLKESNQEIRIRTEPSGTGDWNDIKVGLKNFNIGDITTFLVKTNKIDGLVSGDITIEDPAKTFNITSDLQTDQLRIDNDSIGQIQAHVFYNNKTGNLIANGKTVNPDQKLDFDLNLFLKNLATNGKDVINIKPERYPVKIAERFIGNLFTNLDGYATGPLKIIGLGPDAKYIGKMKLENAGLKVIFTQCYYKLSDGEITFKENELDLGRLTLIDTVTNNTATLTDGVLKHNGWRNMVFNIKAEVDNEPMLLLNTTRKDNSSFYGYALGTGSFSLTGPQSNMRIKIVGKASEKDSSYITIPNTTGKESGVADFLIERKYGRELTDSIFRNNETDLTYDVDITGNPKVNVRVVIDELTNDEIRGRGEGNLRIIAGTSTKMTMRGRFDINDGVYNFSFQSFFKKPFELNKAANNYIEWTGDPFHPIVNIEAVYKTDKKVDFTPLFDNNVPGINISSFRDFVYVIAKMRGDLFKPEITFALDFPSESLANTDPTVAFTIDEILKNENELNKQVAFLVVFNSFAPSTAGSSLSLSSGVDIFVNSISDFLSAQINNVLNNILSNKLKIPGLYVNFSGSLYNPNPFGETNTFNYDRTNLNLSVGKTIFNNRVVITFEGNYDVPIQSATTSQVSSDLLTNFTTEFLINKSGSIRATIFYRENVDLLTGNATTPGKSRKYGTSLTYRKEFNRLGDIFKRKKKLVPTPTADGSIKEGN
ncbi:MAG TPA: translocation/assembly module TamB domain-containing protein [Chitinophagaceae bacterium]